MTGHAGRANLILVVVLSALSTAAVGATATAPPYLDPSFGDRGHVTLQVNPMCAEGTCLENAGSYAEALVIEANGRIVLAGRDKYLAAKLDRPVATLVGLRSDGLPDPAFGNSGIVNSTAFPIRSLYAAPGDRLLAIGETEQGRMAVERYSAQGVPDSSFGLNGLSWLNVPANADAVVVDASERIVAAGGQWNRPVIVKRLSQKGAPDPHFGLKGITTLPVFRPRGGEISLAVARDGDILIAGVGRAPSHDYKRVFIARLSATGRLDPHFGDAGVTYVPLAVPITGDQPSPIQIGVAPNNHVLLATNDRAGRLVVMDYSPTGRLDAAFGRDGISRSDSPTASWTTVGQVHAIGFDARGDAVVAGEHFMPRVDVPGGTAFIARYTTSGLDCSFGARGMAIVPELTDATALATQPDGRIVLAGWNKKAFAAVRYTGVGRPRTCAGEGRGARKWIPHGAVRHLPSR